MTLWNPLNVFSGSEKRAGNDPSSAFDPSRTGDPLPPSHDGPAIGFGDTRVGMPAGYGDPPRRPIGFAPPAEETAPELRYRTELSFKRHHEPPRASATFGPGDDGNDDQAQESWEEPGSAFSSASDDIEAREPEVGGDPVESELEETNVVEADADAVELPQAEERIPFYKREISFRRKRTVLEDGPETEVVGEDEATELAAQADEGPLEDAAEPMDALDADKTDEADPLDDVEVFASEPSEDTVTEAADELPADEPATEELAVEPVAVLADEDSLDPVAAEESEVVDEPVTELPVAVAADEDTSAEEATAAEELESPAADASPDAGDEPLAMQDEHDDMPVAEAPLDEPAEDHAAVDAIGAAWPADDYDYDDDADAGEQKGRFGSRGRRKDKVAKPKPARAAKGGKGRKVVGLKIGASQIAAAVVAETESGHELIELARRPLAAGIVVDGEVRDADALTNAVKAFFDEEKLPKKDVRIGLASNRIGVRTFDIVGIDDEARFDNAVRFKAHEVLPVAVHESVLDYRVLEERPNEAGEPSRRVLLVVAPRDQVEPYAEVARRAGIKLSGIDLEALGLLRAFVEPKPFAVRAVDDTATVVVAIGHESSTLLVAGGGACEFTRVFDWGGGALQESIAAALEVHPAEAATILRHLSLSGPGRQFDGLDEVARAKALDAVRLRLTPFARELVSSLQFYQTQNESLGIGGIVITGGTSHLEGLGEALHQMIGVNVSVGDPLARVVTSGDFDPAIEATMGSMAVPIGLAIDDIAMRSVDLLPKDAVKTKTSRSTMIAFAAPIAAVVPLVAVGVLYMGAHSKAADRQAQLDAVQAEIAALPKPTGPEIDAGVVGEEATRATAVASVLGGRVAWDAVFADLGRVLPANVWLKALSVKQPAPTVLADGTTTPTALAPGQAQPAPTGVTIDGYTYSQSGVARLLARLATLPSLQRVTLTSSGEEKVGKKNVIHFVIVADLNQTGGAS